MTPVGYQWNTKWRPVSIFRVPHKQMDVLNKENTGLKNYEREKKSVKRTV